MEREVGRCAEAYQRGGRWSARRREGFPPGAEHCPKPVARAIYPPATATVRVSSTDANIAGTFGGRPLAIVSRPFQVYRRITLGLWVPNPSDVLRAHESRRQLAKGRSETLRIRTREKQGGQQAALADSGFCHTHGLSQGVHHVLPRSRVR